MLNDLRHASDIKFSLEEINQSIRNMGTISFNMYDPRPEYPTLDSFLTCISSKKIWQHHSFSDGTGAGRMYSFTHLTRVTQHYYPEATFEDIFAALRRATNIYGNFCPDIHRYTVAIATFSRPNWFDLNYKTEYGHSIYELDQLILHGT